MEQILEQIGIIAGGIVVGNILVRMIFSLGHKMKRAVHPKDGSYNYYQQPYYQHTGYNHAGYNPYQTTGYYYN
ncbi:unnamed protein product [Adineta steineri]|uniref:Uncharacterized protein n=2 Tax=Adineta steineri TaxID=433720 RepID=A0A814ADE8_9BILA|nr:unnamed protein product [Adineta steineri]CAF0913240.1 unnamed protein product [Adineta steineri]CAF3821455.1 unnamed protein product [Adineta steineri]